MAPGSRSSRSRAIVRDTLIAVVNDPSVAATQMSSLDSGQLQMVLEHGTAQKLGTSLVACLRAASMPVPDWLEAHRFKVAGRRAVIMSALARVAPAMNDSGIPWVVLKGPVTASSYSSPHLREYGDLDILVPGRSVAHVLEVLSGVGIEDMNRNWEPYLRYGVAEFPVFIGGAPIDLHWHLVGLSSIRARFTMDIDQMIDRRRSLSLSGTDCHRFDTEDHLAHLALHAGLSGAGSIGQLRDIHETVQADVIDWDEFIGRSAAAGTGSLVGHVLDRCVRVLGTPIPEAALARLVAERSRVVRSWMDRNPPLWGGSSKYAFSGFVVEVRRSRLRDTLSVAGVTLRDRVSSRFGGPARWSAYDPDGPLYWNQDGPGGFGEYLSMAAGAE